MAFDGRGRLLLIHVLDLNEHELDWWELPGGGVEAGETLVGAARREFAEETGIPIDGVPLEHVATVDNDVIFAGTPYRLREHVFAAEIGPRPAAGPRALADALEEASVIGQRWWPVDQLTAGGLRLHPPQLLELLARGRRGA
jgi:8-oxo-dGTP pyrophosphatase MutT (NUDIX family)